MYEDEDDLVRVHYVPAWRREGTCAADWLRGMHDTNQFSPGPASVVYVSRDQAQALLREHGQWARVWGRWGLE